MTQANVDPLSSPPERRAQESRLPDSEVTCRHVSGTRSYVYDSDGLGHLIWTCDECGAWEFDSMP